MFEFLMIYCVFLLLIWKLAHLFVSDNLTAGSVSMFPDVTDGEYLAQMPSQVSDEVALKVRSMLVDVSGYDPDEIWPDTTLVELLG